MIKNVLMTADAVGGVWTYALELVQQYEQQDIDVHLAVMGPAPSDDQFFQAASLRRLQLHHEPYKLEWMDDPWDDVERAGEWLLKLEESVQPDVIHLNGFSHGALPWEAPVVSVCHSCVYSWWKAVKGTVAPDAYKNYKMCASEGLRAAGLVVAPTAAMLAKARTFYGPFANERVIYNGRTPLAMPGLKRPYVLASARLDDEAKNAEALRVAAKTLDWPVCAVGGSGNCSGSNYDDRGRVPQNELAQLYATASIFAHPARYEPFGLSALEAAQAGCALVLGDIPSLREIWNDSALYVHPDDPTELARAINRLAYDPQLLATYSRKARARAARYSAEAMADQYLNAYEGLRALRSSRDDEVEYLLEVA